MLTPQFLDDGGDFFDKIGQFDLNQDGVLDQVEISKITKEQHQDLRDTAETQSEWNFLKKLSEIVGRYPATDGSYKGMQPGEGGRFQFTVDNLMDVGDLSRLSAEKLAAAIGIKLGRI